MREKLTTNPVETLYRVIRRLFFYPQRRRVSRALAAAMWSHKPEEFKFTPVAFCDQFALARKRAAESGWQA